MIGTMHLKRDLDILLWYFKHVKKNSTSEIWNFDHYMFLMGMCNEKYTRAIVKTMSKMIVKHKPDAVLNYWNPFMSIAARINKTPLISVIQADTHPHSKGFIWWKEPPIDLPKPVQAVNKILSENQLKSIQSMNELSPGDLTLVLGIPETDPIPNTENTNYIGTLLMNQENDKLPNWIYNLQRDKPVIWLYPGNVRYISGHDSPFDGLVILQACIEALRNLDVHVIVSTGHHKLPEDILPLPANFRHTPFVPGLAMAKYCDLMIHHGGYGSCQTGLFAGTPAVIIPTFSERESNARRIAATGAGDIVLPLACSSGKNKKVNFEELKSKIKLILEDESYKVNARKISEKIKKYGGAYEAKTLIEKFMNTLD
nr:hypothetical protein [Bacteroidota bacterium]